MATAVLGMHRSGTSLVSRLLNLAGLYLGREEDMIPASVANESGFWEHRPLLELNDELLAVEGGTWDAPPFLRRCWHTEPELNPQREKARRILEASFDGQAHWGWKDPRTTLTLPFWQDILGEPLRSVVCVRNPLAVAASLHKAHRMPTAHALTLWQFYNERALLNTNAATRAIVFYEDFFTDCVGTLAPVLELAGLPPLVPGSARARSVTEFLDAGLHHHRFTPEDVETCPDVPEETRELYALLRGRTSAAAEAFARRRQTPERALLFQVQCRAYALELEVRRLSGILDSPPHKLVHRFSGSARRFSPVHRAVTRLLRVAAR